MTWQADNGRQLYCLFLSCGCGFWLALVYELFSGIRHSARHRLSVALWDFVFMLVAAVTLFLFALPLTGGKMRWYVLLGVALGFVAFRQTVGRLLHALCRFLAAVLHASCGWGSRLFTPLWRLLSRPAVYLMKKGQNFLKNWKEKCKKPLQHSGKVLYNQDNNN